MKKVTFLAFLTVLLLQTVSVFAMTTPAAASFVYDLYDIAVTQILLALLDLSLVSERIVFIREVSVDTLAIIMIL